MFNSELPSKDELPSSAQLLRSTLIAFAVAIVLLVTTVLPGEYGIDPTGIGRILGLKQMGEIKEQLAHEADAEAAVEQEVTTIMTTPIAEPSTPAKEATATAGKNQSAQAVVAEVAPEPQKQPPVQAPINRGEMTLTLRPGEAAEVKLEMDESAMVYYRWSANGGTINYDTHGDPYEAPKGFYHGYGKGRAKPSDEGELVAAFDGKHGWFWRNRSGKDVTLTLQVEGEYRTMKRVL